MNKSWITLVTIATIINLSVGQAQTAPLKEYGPYGETQSTVFLLDYLRQKRTLLAQESRPTPTREQSIHRARMQREFPYRSKRLTPGDATTIIFKQSLQLPLQMCLVGHDARSLEWLATEYSSLVKTKTACAIVESNSYQSNQHLQQLYPDIYFYPMIADHISEIHGLKHYPAIITNKGIYPTTQAVN